MNTFLISNGIIIRKCPTLILFRHEFEPVNRTTQRTSLPHLPYSVRRQIILYSGCVVHVWGGSRS